MEELRELETLRRSNCSLDVDDVIRTTVSDVLSLDDIDQSILTATVMEETLDETAATMDLSTDWDSTELQTTPEGTPSSHMTSYWADISRDSPAYDNRAYDDDTQLPGHCDRSRFSTPRQLRRTSSLTHFSTSRPSLCEIPSVPSGGCCLPLKKRYLAVRRKLRSIRHLLKLRMTGRVLAVL